MARVIIKRNPVTASNVGNSEPRGIEPDNGIFEPISDTFTGELVDDVRESTTDDNPTSTRFSGNATEFINPDTGSTGNDNGTGTGRKRRKRSDAGVKRTGSKRGNSSETTKDIRSLLLTVHFGLAGIFHAPKLKLTESEAETLGAAITRVTDLYDIRIIPEKQMAWLNLMITAGCIYIPRIRKDKDADKKPVLVTMPQPVQTQSSGDNPKVM